MNSVVIMDYNLRPGARHSDHSQFTDPWLIPFLSWIKF